MREDYLLLHPDSLPMKRTSLVFLLALWLAPCTAAGASGSPGLFTLKMGGFVNAEFFHDTRRMVSAREGLVPLFPAPVKPDADGHDLNAVPSTTFSLMASRLQVSLTGPSVLGATSSALFEVDFLGTGPDRFNLLRMRHAYLRLDWEGSSLLAGQYWHPLLITSCYPGVVAFGGAPPFHVLNRGPQLRYTHHAGPLALMAALVSQSDFASPGPSPVGGSSSEFIRNSGRPEVAGQLIYNQGRLLAGVTATSLCLLPRTVTASGHQTRERMRSVSGNLFVKYTGQVIIWKVQGIYGDNMAHMVMLGGYAEAGPIDPEKQLYSYTGIRTVAAWTDLETNTRPLQAGLFAGYTENLGSSVRVTGQSWVRGGDIHALWRIAPRIGWHAGPAVFQLECTIDQAAYGTPDEHLRVRDTASATNIRLLAGIRYSF